MARPRCIVARVGGQSFYPDTFHLIYGAFELKRRCELGMGNTVIVIAMLFLKCNKRMPPLRLRHVLFTITLACLISSAPRVTLVH